MRILKRSLTLMVASLLTACAPHESPSPASRDVPLVTKVTRETYMSGDAFCEKYKQYTGLEKGVNVEVPKDYDHPELEVFGPVVRQCSPVNCRIQKYREILVRTVVVDSQQTSSLQEMGLGK